MTKNEKAYLLALDSCIEIAQKFKEKKPDGNIASTIWRGMWQEKEDTYKQCHDMFVKIYEIKE